MPGNNIDDASNDDYFEQWHNRYHRVHCQALNMGLSDADAESLALQYADAEEDLD